MPEKLTPHQILTEMREKGTLRALDRTVADVCTITQNNSGSIAELSEVIMRDAALSANLITTANSVVYAGIETVRTISAAVIRLGFEKVRALALGLTIFKMAGQGARTPDLYRMYAGSYFAGSLAMELLRRKGQPNPEEAFVAGLLLQVPRLILANTFPHRYKETERLLAAEDISFEAACQRTFGIEFSVIRRAVLAHWRLQNELPEPSRERDPEKEVRARLIDEAGELADMIFGNARGGEERLAQAEERIAGLLGQSSFSAGDLVRETAEHDDNIRRFFKLTPRDVEMMLKIVQWGRVSAAQIAASLTLDSAQQQLDEPGEAPEVAIGNFLTEMMHLCRRGADMNHLLLMAQEAAFRCTRPDHVILALLDPAQTVLRGRLHAGAHGKIDPAVATVEMTRRDSPLVQCILSRSSWRGLTNPDTWARELIRETQARHAMMAPILSHDKPIGLQLLTRTDDDPFSKQEQAWLEAITGNLGVGFERQR
jgi:HD-like signal output (HDOD) protein